MKPFDGNIPPNPLGPRICHCGCGHSFQPKRKDRIYLNKHHADHGYNNGPRKERQKNQTAIEKILRKNDQALGQFSCLTTESETIVPLEMLKAVGFKSEYSIGHRNIDELLFYYSYNFVFHIFIENNIQFVKIRKQ